MSKALKITLFVFAGLIGMCIISALMLPSSWEAERSVVIQAQTAEIHPFVEDFRQWRTWAKPPQPDPTTKYSYEGPDKGLGAEQKWIGDRSRGQMKITKSDPASGLSFDTAVFSAEYNGTATIEYEAAEGGTRVTWRGNGSVMPVVGGLFARRIGEGVGGYYENSLGELKTLVEKGGAGTPESGTVAEAGTDTEAAAGAAADAAARPEPAAKPGPEAEAKAAP
ncbi:MAG: SRPBCC family protein [Myxococcales bacterium]|nr:SRPBCC family protein [Myxococcales bacterium]